MPSAIRIEGLTKDYFVGFWKRRSYRALDGLTLDIAPGEIYGFLGPNGAGKTTTLKLLMQLIFPTSGTAEILGRPVGDVGVRRRIGYLPENPYFYDYLTAIELLTYFAHLFGLSGQEARRRAETLLDRVGIPPERRRQQLRKYSKGMIQRVGIAQALLNDPEVIFLDEPMSGLDPLGRRDVRSLILELRDQGRTVFFSSHILADAEALCSRVAVVAAGRLAAAGRLTDMLAFQVRGWELVMANLRPDVVARLGSRAVRATEISKDRYALELSLAEPPERVLVDLVATGATLVSLTPMRDTLEDFFVRRVAEVGEGARAGATRLRPERPFDVAQGRPELAEGRGAKSPGDTSAGSASSRAESRDESERGCRPSLVAETAGDQLRRGHAVAHKDHGGAKAEGPASNEDAGNARD